MNIEGKKLYRSRDKRMIAGVCGGLGEYFGIDPTLIRLGFVLGFFFLAIPGALALVYLVMMIVVPEEPGVLEKQGNLPPAGTGAEILPAAGDQSPIDTEI